MKNPFLAMAREALFCNLGTSTNSDFCTSSFKSFSSTRSFFDCLKLPCFDTTFLLGVTVIEYLIFMHCIFGFVMMIHERVNQLRSTLVTQSLSHLLSLNESLVVIGGDCSLKWIPTACLWWNFWYSHNSILVHGPYRIWCMVLNNLLLTFVEEGYPQQVSITNRKFSPRKGHATVTVCS